VARLQPQEDGRVGRVAGFGDDDALERRERRVNGLLAAPDDLGGVRLGVRVVERVRRVLAGRTRDFRDAGKPVGKVG